MYFVRGLCCGRFEGVGVYFGVAWFWLRFALLVGFGLSVLDCCFAYCGWLIDLLACFLCFGLLVDCWRWFVGVCWWCIYCCLVLTCLVFVLVRLVFAW